MSMKWQFGEVLVNKVSGERYVVEGVTESQCLILKSEDNNSEVRISISLLDDLFKTTWSKWHNEQFAVLHTGLSVRWKHNRKMTIMECPEYGLKVYARLHPEDTFDIYTGRMLCKIRMIKKFLDIKEKNLL